MNKWIIIMASIALVGLLPAAAADDLPYAYVSGECYNDDASEGGDDAVGVSEDGSVMVLDPVPGSGGATDALAWFAGQTVEDGGQTGEACEHNGTSPNNSGDSDHLQVRAGWGDIVVVVCYDGQANTEPSRCPAAGEKA